MKVLNYHNHPKYNPQEFLDGFDISVYIVDDIQLGVMHFLICLEY